MGSTIKAFTIFLSYGLATAIVCSFIGFGIGRICKGRITIALLLAIIACIVLLVAIEFIGGNNPLRWWEYTAYHLVNISVYYIPFIIVPLILAAVIAGKR